MAALQGLRDYHTITIGPTAWNWAAISLTSSICAYQVILTIIYVFIKDVPKHSLITHHLFSISASLFLHIYITTLGQYLHSDTHVALTWVEYTLFGLTALQIVCVGFIPCAPEHHFDLKRVYNKAVAAAITKEEEAQIRLAGHEEVVGESPLRSNMINEYSSSILSQLILGWVAPVVSKMANMEQADIQDLPGLHIHLTTQFTAVDAAMYSWAKISPERWGETRALLWEVWFPQWRVVLPGKIIHRSHSAIVVS
jgi:hypothetical protein